MKDIKHFLVGIVLGVANVIPGVSAGTMAVILNVYDKLLDAMSFEKLKQKDVLRFIVMMLMGIVTGILMFSSVIKYLYENFNLGTNFFFIGIIIGSIPMIWQQASKEKTIEVKNLFPFVIALIIMVFIATRSQMERSGAIWQSPTMWQAIWLSFAAALSAFAMIIPGISGSFIMLTLGVYTTTITAISAFNFHVLVPVGIGVLIGIGVGGKLVKRLLKRYTQATYLAILGLVVGSIFALYVPFKMNIEGMIAVVLMLLGCGVSYFFSKK